MSDQPVVGVVGDLQSDATEAIEAAGGRIERGDPETVHEADPDRLVAVGESSALAVAREQPAAPIVAVEAGRGLRSLSTAALVAATDRLVTGEFESVAVPLLAVEQDGTRRCRAVADVTLVTAEAAHISEYTVATDGQAVGRFRADGVVVATPAGSSGYARMVGGPVLAPGTDSVVAAPIAPFATSPDHWVVPQTGVTLTVERDEADVSLVADDQPVGQVDPREPVSVQRDGTATLAVFAESATHFG